jgi:hypothetical protein
MRFRLRKIDDFRAGFRNDWLQQIPNREETQQLARPIGESLNRMAQMVVGATTGRRLAFGICKSHRMRENNGNGSCFPISKMSKRQRGGWVAFKALTL